MAEIAKSSRIRSDVVKVKQWLIDGRAKLLKQHRDGSPGIQVCNHLTELLDTVVLEIFESALNEYGEQSTDVRSRIALVPYGGFGRREMAPYSDLDLMLLHLPGALPLVGRLAQRLVQDFSDAGLELGFSVRTVRQATQLAARDPIVYASLVDTRFLGGSVRLYTQFLRAVRTMTRRRSQALIQMVEQARRAERAKYGETVYLLEPNIKRSRGGLRDLQLIRWIGFARYGISDPKQLEQSGNLSQQDYRRFVQPYNRLLIETVQRAGVPVINFSTGTAAYIQDVVATGGDVIGVDWRMPLGWYAQQVGPHKPIQGNLEPVALLAPWRELRYQVDKVLDEAAARPGHIFNLGHGIFPNTPVENVQRVVDYVHERTS